MKDQILKILKMQADGKLTQDQAAELLAIMADQARENGGAASPQSGEGPRGTGAGGTQSASSAGAPGPSGAGSGGKKNGYTSAGAAIHGLVDTAIGVGTTVGRVATVWGGEFLDMVHREQGGNSVTLSKVETPHGQGYTFGGNTINVSKVVRLALNFADFSRNVLNASKIDHFAITRGQFAQCDISGSSLSQVTIEGAMPAVDGEAAPGAPAATQTGIRALTCNASKVARLRISGGSTLESSRIQAAGVKDLELSDGSAIRDSRINDAGLVGTRMERVQWSGVEIAHSHVQEFKARDLKWDRVSLSGMRLSNATVSGGTWTNVRVGWEAGKVGGCESLIQESNFENCTLTGCQFVGCIFRRTTLRNLNLEGISLRNVDFTGMILETNEAFRKAAGL